MGLTYVPIVKPNGDLRICGDHSVTINKFSVMEQYPIPSLKELLSKLSGGTRFTKLDLSQAYHQLELTPESRKYKCTPPSTLITVHTNTSA